MCSKYDIYVPTQKPTHNYFEGFFFPPRALFSMTNSHKSKMSISDFVESQDTAMIRSLESDRPIFKSQLCRL